MKHVRGSVVCSIKDTLVCVIYTEITYPVRINQIDYTRPPGTLPNSAYETPDKTV